MKYEDYLASIYYNPKHAGAYGGVKRRQMCPRQGKIC